jgi:CHASE2 domain-containing sensor protein
LTLGLLLTLASGVLSLYQPTFLTRLEARFSDSQVPKDPPPKGYVPPLVVAVDDESLARIGRWPWPRSVIAKLLTAIAAQHPASVGIDAIFAEPEARPDGRKGQGAAGALSAGDRELAKALGSAPFVLGYQFTFSGSDRSPHLLHPLKTVTLRLKHADDPMELFWRPSGVVSSLPEFAGCVASSGFLNAAMEQEGVLRRMPVLMEQGGKLYPSLALATVLRALGSDEVRLASTWSGERLLQVAGRRIPLGERGRLLLRYRDWQAAVAPFSALALLEGRLPADTLRGRVVFLGATATGMGEAVATPLSSMMSGVQVHALAADNMLRGDFARQSPWLYRFLAVLALGSVATLVSLWLSALRGAALLSLVSLVAWQGAGWLFRSRGMLLSPVFPVLVLTSNFTLLSLLRSFYLEKGALRQKHDLSQARDLIMTSLASLTEIRDTETGAHVLRCERYLLILCRELSHYPRFSSILDEDTILLVSKLAALHDIGKVGLPDQLLRKASGFTAEEYEQMKKHTLYGRDAIARAASRVGASDDELIQYAKDITYSHHERWDGSGYPEGLRGEAIPWPGRVMALVDAYDAMVTQRVYNKPVSHDVALSIIVKGKGILFDPEVVEAFLKVEGRWREVAREIAG